MFAHDPSSMCVSFFGEKRKRNSVIRHTIPVKPFVCVFPVFSRKTRLFFNETTFFQTSPFFGVAWVVCILESQTRADKSGQRRKQAEKGGKIRTSYQSQARINVFPNKYHFFIIRTTTKIWCLLLDGVVFFFSAHMGFAGM